MGQLRELVHNLAEKQMQDQWAMGSSGIGANGCAAQFVKHSVWCESIKSGMTVVWSRRVVESPPHSDVSGQDELMAGVTFGDVSARRKSLIGGGGAEERSGRRKRRGDSVTFT
jgi:hypothetical protein